MKIGIDIDNTIVNNKQVINKYYNEFSGKENGACYTEMPEEKRRKFLDLYLLNIFREVELYDGVKEVFDYLNNQKHQIYIITRRGYQEHEDTEKITIEYLKKHNLKYHEIYFEVLQKGKLCRKLDVPILIDDHDFNLYDALKNGVTAIKFGGTINGDFYNFDNWNDLLIFLKEKGY